MKQEKDYTIAKVAWLTQLKGAASKPADIVHEFWMLVSFLQSRGLTARTLARNEAEIDDAFAIRASDLTELGIRVMRRGLEKWLTGIDKGKRPEDLKPLEKALERESPATNLNPRANP